ncbi:MAG: Asp-tRNA(Asn)/Glu-tRNA(Gln) amidotransferase subunit GatB [Chitinophagaceae bacterium]
MINQNNYETVVGLEVHAQLLTKSKLFCGDSIAYGAEPNTQVSPITLAHPGTLPRMNKKAIEFAIKIGLACHCEIEKKNFFARKNYFYPDLPKGYQISQHTTPICKHGFVKIKSGNSEKKIRLNRIHIEEDAGKSLHDVEAENTCIDYNRAGTPLIEIVSEPDIRSSDEAYNYLSELRKLVRYLDVSDGNMEEGSFRCDANISVRKIGDLKLGIRVEVKNLNSIRNVKKAIDFESDRLINLLEKGQPIVQQTRSFDANNGTTFSIRDKEDADDYRYFADPDLTPFHIEDDYIETIRKTIPELQEERVERYISVWHLPEYDAYVLTDEKETADYFEKIIEHTSNYKAASNWMLGPVKSWLNENNKSINDFPLAHEQIAKLVHLVENGKVNFSVASCKLFPFLINNPDREPEEIALEKNLIQQSGADFLEPLINEILENNAEKVKEYKKGKKGLLSLFVGEVMKRSKGKADPRVTNDILLEKLKS